MEIKRAREEEVNWTFGIGLEGIRKKRKYGWGCVIIDSSFPWWYASACAEDLKLYRIWLNSYVKDISDPISKWVGDVNSEYGIDPSSDLLDDLQRCQIVLVGGRIPNNIAKCLWSSPQCQLVLSTKSSNATATKRWKSFTIPIRHAEVGGVTDGSYDIIVHILKDKVRENFHISEQPRQDLRWVLKSGIWGEGTEAPSSEISKKSYTTVNWIHDLCVHSAGLYPIKKENIMVFTHFGGSKWVERNVTLTEKLSMWDVPEHFTRGLDESAREALVNMLSIPGKVLHGVLRSSVQVMKAAQTSDSIQQCGRKRFENEISTTLPLSSKRARKVSSLGVDLVMELPAIQPRQKWNPTMDALRETSDDDRSIQSAREDPNIKATKSDDAQVRYDLWNSFLKLNFPHLDDNGELENKLNPLRQWLMKRWRRNVRRSYYKWERETIMSVKELELSREAAYDCFQRCENASWWTWEDGSRPLFWRWPPDYVILARDGLPPWFTSEMKPWRVPQRPPRLMDKLEVIRDKLEVVRRKRYVTPGRITSLMSFFEVPKGLEDVRMVYDGSASGLNDVMWAPWFPLPTVESLVRAVDPGYNMADNDVGEMFHNFVMHEDLQQHCGLDFSNYFRPTEVPETKRFRLWERWTRLAMGLKNSPYTAVQGMMFAEEVIRGDKDKGIFRWSHVRLNLPGSETYDPNKSWVCKVRKCGQPAADIFTYVDDIRSSAPTRIEAWEASQRTSSILAYLGLQDAARKRRDPGTETGAWTGSVVWTSDDEVSVMTTVEKWNKTKQHINWMVENINNPKGMDMHIMQSYRGFLVYVARTYPSFVPYLKGIHATIDSWRPGRNVDGWKIKIKSSTKVRSEFDDEEIVSMNQNMDVEIYPDVPNFVKPVRRLKNDLQSLLELTNTELPPRRKVRMNGHARVIYGFGDASKLGFGATIDIPDQGIYWRHGQWTLEAEQIAEYGKELESTLVEERSSNYRELRNLVEAIEHAYRQKWLSNKEIFMFTDNSTAESAYFKGTSSSELLFNLILRLRKIEMSGQCKLHLIHVSGTRMIWQGTDGLSRGDYTSGVMAGRNMLSFVPLHLNALDRSNKVLPWLKEWCTWEDDGELTILTHNDWPKNHEMRGIYIWTPAPAAADVASEYMAKSIHKRPHSVHVFVCPRLMTARWFRLTSKSSDLLLYIPIGHCIWSISQHEPLLLFISLPLSRSYPWKHRNTKTCTQFGKTLQTMLNNNSTDTSSVLRECIGRAKQLAPV